MRQPRMMDSGRWMSQPVQTGNHPDEPRQLSVTNIVVPICAESCAMGER